MVWRLRSTRPQGHFFNWTAERAPYVTRAGKSIAGVLRHKVAKCIRLYNNNGRH